MEVEITITVRKVRIPEDVAVLEIFGQYDKRARYLKKLFNVEFAVRDSEILIKGMDEKSVDAAHRVLDEIISITRDGHLLDWTEFEYLVERVSNSESVKEVYSNNSKGLIIGKKVKPKTLGQKKYLEAVEKNDVVFVIGPAGTGKTYLAVAVALDYLKMGKVNRIILTRPAVEAGEKLGYLPGDLSEKVEPYLRPLYDAIIDITSPDKFNSYRERGIIEIVPLAYMRGRTLNNSFIILDEAQNTTYQQMKMFLTRLGFNSKAVITGDITQVDIEKEKSGLIECQKILEGISGIEFVYLNESDVVRHPLVKKIIKAYEEYERSRKS
ncbi:DEAD/DEAH box helicase [Thermotoga maritima MSB8]|uniref:PhoH-like protein n=1 Tax=Thermotoga maritima (strain ATCC 43589 / DSM 3109 / JCM 10099 / NBRC 100826 / MSB8) TaxID=243274 RepID=Q9X1J5_THEMA|nr:MULTISPECIES: PhoH family protein [Thermotoga]AAD36574.1 phoH-related protein [Thermotoga maritima MSB8]AGL50439.1 Phosphate starvation-inducible protein PhoH, predicted ATPase [Thermotoga maritima MSB8]AIY86862.1 phoH-related protein [Thermotoga sp. 2812B]AKE27395.1 DEAD/DEAH box helicase [Thermotoga maritima]AKE29267.1 DEAD/DEAH box helicase [Thermotoga maritima MSB8]